MSNVSGSTSFFFWGRAEEVVENNQRRPNHQKVGATLPLTLSKAIKNSFNKELIRKP